MADSIFLEGTDCECDVTIDTWLKDALPLVSGAVREVAARQLVLTCREFFERTLTWQARIANVNAKAGSKQYWLSPFDEFANVIGVLGVVFRTDGSDASTGRDLIPLARKPAGSQGTSGIAKWYYSDNPPDAVYLYPELEEDIDDALDFYVALTPKPTVEHLPRIAFLKFYDVILEGFLARMYRQPNKPYTDVAQSRMCRATFISECGRFMGQAKQGYVGAQNWSYPPTWGVKKPGVL